MPKLTFLLLALACSLGLSACGGSSDDQNDSTVTLSKASFIKKGDAICEKTDEAQADALQAYGKKNPNGPANKAEQEQLIVDIGLGPIRVEAEELAELGAPEGQEQAIEAIITGIETATDKAEEDPASTIKAAGNPYNAVNKLAREFGFIVCAEVA
jgi:hypothetical protein